MRRFQRWLGLLGDIKADRGFVSHKLADKYGVTRRTITKDLREMSEAGIPIFYDHQRKKYTFTENFFIPPLCLHVLGRRSSNGDNAAEVNCETVVRIWFHPDVAGLISQVEWHASQEITALADGDIHFTVSIKDLMELKAWVLSFGWYAEILEPEDLRQELIADLEKMLALYRTKRESGISSKEMQINC